MKKPNIENRNGEAAYLRELVSKVTIPELLTDGRPSQRKIAARIGVSERTFREYLQLNNKKACPYPVQYCLEALAS